MHFIKMLKEGVCDRLRSNRSDFEIDRTLKSIGRSDQLKSAVATKNGLVGLYDQITGYGNSNTKQMQ